MTCYLRKRVRGGVESETWWLRYQFDGMKRPKDVCLKVRDKQVAKEKMAAFVREHEREAAGIIAPKVQREAAAKSMTDHLADFVADLRAKGRAKMYADNTDRLNARLFREAKWERPADVTAESFVAWRAGATHVRTGEPLSAKSRNEYLNHARALLSWMQRQGRIVANPLAFVGKVEQRGRDVRKPRALTDAEVAALLAAAGPRRVVYLTALVTGMRRGELRQLAWGDVHLDADRPCVSLRATTTKNRRAAVQWLRADLVAELRALRPSGVGDGARVFKRVPPVGDRVKPKPGTLRADLEAAGIGIGADGSGRWVTFHSLRHTLNASLARAGVDRTLRQSIMRHSDPRLTDDVYLDRDKLPTVGLVDRLPSWDSGTHMGTHAAVPAGHPVTQCVTTPDSTVVSQVVVCGTVGEAGTPGVTPGHVEAGSWGTRIRT